MNEDIIKGKWSEIKGDVQKKWGKLTDDDLDQINGDRTKLSGKIQKAYGIERDEVEKQLKDWETEERLNKLCQFSGRHPNTGNVPARGENTNDNTTSRHVHQK